MNKNRIKQSQSAAIEYCKALLPMNYSSDESALEMLTVEDRNELAITLKTLDPISDATKLAILPKSLIENVIQSTIIANMSNDVLYKEEQLKIQDQEIYNLKAVVGQNSLSYDDTEIEKAKAQSKLLLEQKNKNRKKNIEKGRAIGLRYLGLK